MRSDALWRLAGIAAVLGLSSAYFIYEGMRPTTEYSFQIESNGARPSVDAPGASESPPAATAAAGSNWQLSSSRSLITGHRIVQLRTSAGNVIRTRDASFRPTLVLHCDEPALRIFVATGLPAQQEPESDRRYRVAIRFGDSPLREFRTAADFEDRSLLLEPVSEILTEMRSSATLEFFFTPRSSKTVGMRFDLSGFAEMAPQLEEVCPS